MRHSKPVRLESRYIGTGPHLPGSESVYLFLEFTIIALDYALPPPLFGTPQMLFLDP